MTHDEKLPGMGRDLRSEYPEVMRHFLSVCIALVPAWYFGFGIGGHVSRVGPSSDPGVWIIALRGLECGVLPALVALFAPRYWLAPWAIYSLFFYCGYTFLIFGSRRHPELVWVLIISFWLAAFVSMLRIHFSRAMTPR